MNDRERIALLEKALIAVPKYIENWNWAEEYFDILKTIPEFGFPTIALQERFEEELSR